MQIAIIANASLLSFLIRYAYNQNYTTTTNIQVEVVTKFYEFFIKLSSDKQKNVLDNLHNRLNTIKIEIDDDLPF